MTDDATGDALEFMSYFDWFTPLYVLIRNLLTPGGTHTILIPRDVDGWSWYSIFKLLNTYGITHWGHLLFAGNMMITVKRRQAAWAQYVLDSNGIPITGRRVAGNVAGQQRRPVDRQRRERRQAEAKAECTMFEWWRGS